MSLHDGFGRCHRYLRLALTDRCNLRCVYCMPAAGIPWRPRAEILTFEEIERLARLLVTLGIDKIRLTGGEPTVRQGLVDLVARLAAIPNLRTLAMTTNGVRLSALAEPLKRAGLQALNISLDTLRPARFHAMTGQNRLSAVLAGIDAALAAGFETVKLNVVVIAGVNDDELGDFVTFARDRPLTVRFIEFMPFRGNLWSPEKFIPWRTLYTRIAERYELVPVIEDDIEPSPRSRGDERGSESGGQRGSAGVHTFLIPNHSGRISFIAPLSEDFCRHCDRLRLTADGAMKSCLLREAEVDLREPLRAGANDADLAVLIAAALTRKDVAHPPPAHLPEQDNRAMFAIGG